MREPLPYYTRRGVRTCDKPGEILSRLQNPITRVSHYFLSGSAKIFMLHSSA
jgi:hypothetical protein